MDGGIVGAGQVPSPRGLGLVTGIKHRDEMELSAGASQVHGFNTDPPHRFNAISSPLAHHALCEGQVYYSGLGQDKIPTSVCFSLIIFSLCRTALSQIEPLFYLPLLRFPLGKSRRQRVNARRSARQVEMRRCVIAFVTFSGFWLEFVTKLAWRVNWPL